MNSTQESINGCLKNRLPQPVCYTYKPVANNIGSVHEPKPGQKLEKAPGEFLGSRTFPTQPCSDPSSERRILAAKNLRRSDEMPLQKAISRAAIRLLW